MSVLSQTMMMPHDDRVIQFRAGLWLLQFGDALRLQQSLRQLRQRQFKDVPDGTAPPAGTLIVSIEEVGCSGVSKKSRLMIRPRATTSRAAIASTAAGVMFASLAMSR